MGHCWESPCYVHSVLEWDSMGRHTLGSGWSLLVWSGPSPVTPEERRPSREYTARAGRYIYPVISSRDGCACGLSATTEETRQPSCYVTYVDSVNTLWTTSLCLTLCHDFCLVTSLHVCQPSECPHAYVMLLLERCAAHTKFNRLWAHQSWAKIKSITLQIRLASDFQSAGHGHYPWVPVSSRRAVAP